MGIEKSWGSTLRDPQGEPNIGRLALTGLTDETPQKRSPDIHEDRQGFLLSNDEKVSD